MQIAPFSWSVCVYPQRRLPCDQYSPDMINYPYAKLIVLLQMMLYKVLMHYIDCDTIQVVPWSSCSRYQRVFTYRRGSLWRYRSLLIIKSRYLMDMSPLHHVVRLYDITSCSWCLSSLHYNGNVTHTLTSDLKIYVSGKFCILSGRIVNFRYCKNE